MNMLRAGELPDSYIKDILESLTPYGNIARNQVNKQTNHKHKHKHKQTIKQTKKRFPGTMPYESSFKTEEIAPTIFRTSARNMFFFLSEFGIRLGAISKL